MLDGTMMKALHFISAMFLVPALAQAQSETPGSEDTAFDHEVAPVPAALEIAIGTGYAQGGGPLGGSQRHLQDLTGPGGSIELDVGARVSPYLTLGVYGTFSKYAAGDFVASSSDVFGATAGIQAVAHLRPDRSVDPWVSIGTGWKALWLSPDQGKATALQGLELSRVQVGIDYRLSRDVSISPVVGASVGMYVSESSPMTTDYTEIKDKEVNFTGFAGLSGRFDVH